MTNELSSSTTWQWHAAGAWHGGSVVGVAAAATAHGPLRFWAATRAGLICSDDLGQSWMDVWRGPADPSVIAVVAAGEARQGWPTLFAATETGRLYRSEDGGASWAEVVAWAGLGVAAALCPSPAYADDGILFVGTREGVFRTLDGGVSWESSTFGLTDLDVLCLACAPDFATSQLLWAGSAGGGLYRSRNQARAWREAGAGLPDAAVQTLAVSPAFAENRTLFAGLEGAGVCCSRDGGENWSSCAEELAGHSVNALVCLDDGRTLIAATDQGIYVSGDAAKHWRAAEGTQSGLLALTAMGEIGVGGVYGAGVLVTRDGGRHWRPAATPPLHVPPLVAVAGLRWVGLDVDGAMGLSQDGGASWLPLAPPDVDGVYALACTADRPDGVIVAATSAGLCSLEPDEAVWSVIDAAGLPADAPAGLEFAADGAARLVYSNEGRLFVAPDASAAWQEITGPWQGQTLMRALPAQDESGHLRAIALTMTANEQGYYAIHLWLYQNGAWANVADMAADIPSMLANWPSLDRIWLATQHRIVHLHRASPAHGWEANQHFFAPGEQITALVAPRNQEDAWAATTRALYHARGIGMPWNRMADLPDGRPVVYLHGDASGLEVMTLGGRVWRGGPAAA